MSVTRSLSWIINKLWLTLAILLVLAAVLISGLRYALPHLPDISNQLEQQIEQRLQQPVAIQQLAMSWHPQGPALDVDGIRLTEGENSPINVNVERVSVVLDFWQSLLQRQLVAQEFILHNAAIEIDLRKWQNSDQNNVNLARLESLFLQRLERFSLTDSEISVINLAGAQRSIMIDRLSWLNQGQNHQGVGQMRVRNFTTNSLDFIVQLQGSRLSDASGQFYLDSRQIDISPWLEKQLGDVDILASNVNFTSWLSITDGQLSDGYLELRDNRIDIAANGQQLSVHIPSGQALLAATDEGWLLNTLPMDIDINQQRLALPRIAWQSEQQSHRLSIQQLPLHELVPLGPIIDSSLGLSISGALEQQQRAETRAHVDLQLQREVNGELLWQLRTSDLASAGGNGVPSWSPMTLAVAGNQHYGFWRLVAQQLTLSGEALSPQQAWQFSEFAANGQWQADDKRWSVALEKGVLRKDDLALTLQGQLTQQADQTPNIALQAFSNEAFSVQTVRQLLPQAMGVGVRNYLQQSLRDGTVRGLEALWRGPLNQFPSDDMQGVFAARLEFDALTYQFQPDWPALQETPLRLDFFQHQLRMYADEGQLKGATVKQVSAEIADLTDGAQGIQITSQVTAPSDALQQVFASSPLTSVTETLQQVQPQEPISGEFSLDIPFDGSREVGVTVNADLSGQRVYVSAIDQYFGIPQGKLQVNNARVTTNQLVLDWFGRPIDTQVNGQMKDEVYQLQVDTQLDWQLEPLLDNLPMQGWQRYFYGAVNGSGQLTLALSDTVAVDWQSQYDLTGLESNLPAPLAKEFGESWQLNIDLNGDQQQLQLTASVDDRLRWKSHWQPGAKGWQSASLLLGEPPNSNRARASGEQNEFIIEGHLPELNVAAWYDLVYFLQQDMDDMAPSNSGEASFMPTFIDVTTPQLSWAGQRFADAELEIWPQAAGWNGRVFAHNLAMEVAIPGNFLTSPIEVDADFVQLSSDLDIAAMDSGREEEGQWQWVKRLPAIAFTCKTCKLDNKSFVDVEVDLAPVEDGIQLSRLRATNNSSTINAAGYWLVAEGAPTTQVSGQLQSPDIGELLRQYGIETAIRDSAADIDFGLHWQGHPHNVDMETLGGAVSWDLGQGYLAEVSDGGARLFSLLSLDGILRKLTLDFRDIFSQGMFYTDLTGSVQIEDGIAVTNDTEMLGSAGNMEINGTTNLVNRQLDYELTYAPKVTSSLPVILAWMVNPPSGLAALLIDKVLQDAEVISQLRYQVSGTIDNPQVTEVERDSRPVDLPELEQPQEENPDAPSSNGNPTQ